ncbi:hypothetical protein AM2_032 [Lactococcus phage AM2]|uniref:Uncharacterized protein n=7 Tax=Audreyjarvisvirus AM1 TaxID=2845188 RepID=A0A1W6JLJ1_9CAUD|nr:hypothetical protein H1Z30_gp032 [Lactococcus phage AM1]ARM66337.1 hypothetical protein AM2_032 [Lactococcus phage AM2]ARM66514.1 hypothetical protein AM3_032 [Lactococcus phage AM3]ARM67067.1 hypothetical protein AM8_032 [Lactococcus phage AM8]ARM67245.1 hypothetical protein AM9_032 [Lactococcus phage AM9]ARM67424.1 hypothetical protein AM11_032 [Lactococcus phage AM11]ARQ95612.1 hypothetical protein AM12_033 [Lactococcus phage AM12]
MEKTKEFNQLTIDVTELGLFNGLYNTIWLNDNQDIDEVMELAGMLRVHCHDIDVSINKHEYLKGIAELYCEMLEYELDERGTFTVKEVYSPRWYNFDTDHVVISWESDTFTVEEMQEELQELISTNDSKEDMDIETELWIDRGYELYSNMTSYKYKGQELWFDMDADDIAKVKG